VIDGSIQEAGDRFALTVHLTSTQGAASPRSWSFDVPRSRLSRLAETAAANIAAQFRAGAAAGPRTRLARLESTDPQAYVQYLRGRHILNRRAGAKKALPYLQEAVGREPTFAPAHAALGEAYLRVGIFSQRSARAEPWSNAEIAIRRALALDDSLAIAHATLGWLYMFRDWNWPLARAELGRAIELDPDDPNAHSNYAIYLRGAGRMDEAIEQRCLARDADPLSVELTTWLGNEYLFARRYADAVATFEAALDLEPAFIPALDGRADGLQRMGLGDRAAEAQIRLFNVRGDTKGAAVFEEIYRRQGYAAAVTYLDRKAIDDYSGNPERRAWNLAYTHARLGETNAALRYLAIAFEQRDPGLLQVRVDPDVDSLRADPRFQRLIAQLGIWP
jgi:tetratricopeptide (TPR) repeat protein